MVEKKINLKHNLIIVTNEDKIFKVVQWLMDNGQLCYNADKKLEWAEKK